MCPQDNINLIQFRYNGPYGSSGALARRWVMDVSLSQLLVIVPTQRWCHCLNCSSTSVKSWLFHAKIPLRRISLTLNYRHIQLQWAHYDCQCSADWQHIILSDESRYNLEYNDGCVLVKDYKDESLFWEYLIQRHTGRTSSA